jgi:hypothetical protein
MVWFGKVLFWEVLFEEMNKAVVRVGIADGAELPAVATAIHLAEDQGAFALVGRLRAEGVTRHLLALAIHGADVGRLHLTEVLPLLDALVNADEKQGCGDT